MCRRVRAPFDKIARLREYIKKRRVNVKERGKQEEEEEAAAAVEAAAAEGEEKKKQEVEEKRRRSARSVGGSHINISEFHFCWFSIRLGTVREGTTLSSSLLFFLPLPLSSFKKARRGIL